VISSRKRKKGGFCAAACKNAGVKRFYNFFGTFFSVRSVITSRHTKSASTGTSSLDFYNKPVVNSSHSKYWIFKRNYCRFIHVRSYNSSDFMVLRFLCIVKSGCVVKLIYQFNFFGALFDSISKFINNSFKFTNKSKINKIGNRHRVCHNRAACNN